MSFARIHVAALACLLPCIGCAAVFRDSKQAVQIESTPSGAAVSDRSRTYGATPTAIEVDRGGTANVRLSKPGYADHHGVVAKKLNVGWVVADVVTCVIPVALCIPLLVDAISGAWNDVPDRYHAVLRPEEAPPPPPAVPSAPGPGAPPPPGAPPAPPAPPPVTPAPGDIQL